MMISGYFNRYLLAGVVATLPAAMHAQETCIPSFTYSPQNPLVGQAITVNLTVTDPLPPTPGLSPYYLTYGEATEPGYPELGPYYGSVAEFPGSFSFTFVPYMAGQVTVSIGGEAFGSGAANSTCGSFVPGGSAVITVAPQPSTLPNYDGLHGQFAFSFNGLNPQIKGASTQLAAIGSFTADGLGHITAGTEDVNSGSGSSTLVPITGSYTIDPAGIGALKIVSSFGTQQLSFSRPLRCRISPAHPSSRQMVTWSSVQDSSRDKAFPESRRRI